MNSKLDESKWGKFAYFDIFWHIIWSFSFNFYKIKISGSKSSFLFKTITLSPKTLVCDSKLKAEIDLMFIELIDKEALDTGEPR